jgi:hypothetical protein
MPINLFEGGTNLAIELDRPAGPYYPGDVIHATVTLDSEKETEISEFRVGLLAWEASTVEDDEGGGSRHVTVDETVAAQTLMGETDLAAGHHGTYQVDLPIPADAFPPYASSSLESNWRVKATLDRHRKRDVNASVVVPLVVPPPGKHAQAGAFGESSEPGTVELKLWLPSLEWVEGETIEGRLLIHPRKSFDASEVRVDLKRHEKVHAARYKHSTIYPSLDRVVLAGKTRFEPGQQVDLPFRLPIRVMGCPTRHTASSTVVYTLEARLSRRLRKDFTAGTEIWLYNGRRM